MWKVNKLFCERNKEMSIGRVSLWLTLIPALHIWWTGSDIEIHHLYVLGFLLLYGSYKKLPEMIAPLIELSKALIELLKARKG